VRPRRAAARGPRLAVVVLVVVVVVVMTTRGAAVALIPAGYGSVSAATTPRPESVGNWLLLVSVLVQRRSRAALERRAAPAAQRRVRGATAAAPSRGAAGVAAALHEAAVAGVALLRRAVELLQA